MKLKYIYITIAFFVVSFGMYGQISITSLPATYSNNFDSYNPTSAANVPSTINSTGTGTGLASATTGWTAASSGTATYIGRTTSGNSGGFIAYGSPSTYSLGALRSGTPGNITYTLSFTNNSGAAITSLTLAWNYKQWTYVNTSGWNVTGTGALASNTTLNASDFAGSATGTNGTPATTPVSSFTLSGLSIANGASFGFTWVTTDVSGSDSGVAIDDFSLAASAADVTAPTVTTLSPLDDATSVTTTSNLVLTFNENVVVGTAGNIIIYNSDNSVFETIPYNDSRITFNGTTGVTINPTGTFANNSSYYVQIGSAAVRDVALNNYAGISNATDWNFTTVAADVTPPIVTTLSPTDGATGVTTTSNLDLTFNKNVVVGTAGNIVIYNSDNSVFETIPYNDSRITFNGTTGVTINPTGTFANSASYYVQIGSSVIRDVALNNYAGISNATDWNFTTVAGDVTPPTVTTLSPADGATGVTTTSNLVLTFNENVVVGTAGNIVIYNSDNSVFETIPYNDSRITFDGTTGVTINPTGTFVNSASYYVQIGSAAIRDVTLNNYAGISNATDWNFTTVAAAVGSIWTNPITGTSPGLTSPYTTGQTFDANITVSGISRGSGIAGNAGNDRYNANNWSTTTIDANDYFEFTLTPTAGYKINLTSFVYTGQVSSGTPSFAFRSSTDTYAADIGTPTTNGTTISLSGAAYQNLVTAVTFRFYAYGLAASTTTYSINDFTFNGSVSVAGPTLVTSTPTLSSFSYVAGGGPSSSQTFNLSGVSLTGFPSNLTINGSTNYEVSTDNSSFGASRTLGYTAATLTATPIYVRLKAGLIAGTYNGETISISGGGATAVNVTCNGSVIPPYFRSKNTTGNWATASDWESSADNSSWSTASQVPTAAATVITIQGTHTMSIASGSVTADDITVATGGTLTISGGTFTLNDGTATADLQVNGTLTYSSGTFTQGASGVAFGSGSTYNHAVVGTSTMPIATWDVASTCIVTGATGTIPTNIAQSYGNFTWNCTGQSTFLNVNNNAFQVRGLFRLLSTGSSSYTFTMGSTVPGTYSNTINAASIEGGVFAIAYTSGVTSTTTITTDLSISGGEVRINGSAGTGTLNVGRDLLMSGTGYLNPLFASNSPSTTITITGNLTMSGNSYIVFENANNTSGSSTINVGGNFTCTSAGFGSTNPFAIDFGGSSASGIVSGNALNISGNFSYTGSGQMQTTSQNAPTGIVFNGSGLKTFTYTTAITIDWVPITINPGTTLQLQNSFSIGESTVLPVTTITVNGTLDFQNYAITAVTSTIPQFNTSSGGTLLTANTAGLGGTGTTGSLRGFGSVAATTPANGRAVFLAGTNYTYNADTTAPFPATFGNPAIINVNAAVTSNMTSNLTVTSAVNVNNGGTFALNPTTNSLNLNGAALTINTGGTFDTGGENQVINGGGSPTVVISGKFITRDAQGFMGTNAALPSITPTLISGCTIEYGLAGNQAVQGSTAPTYQNITFSGGGTKTLASANSVIGTITISGATTFDAGNNAFGSTTSNVTMTGASLYKLSGTTASKPESGGTYTLDPLSTFEFTGTADTNIRVSTPVINYANIIISGTARNPATVTGIKFQSGRSFTVKSGGVFRLNNTAGFTGSTTTAIDNTNPPTITLETGSRIEFAGNQVLPATQTITPFATYSDVGISGTGTKTLANTTEVYVGRDLLLFPEATPANTGFLQIDANRLLTVERNILNTSTKDLIVKDSGNLVQVTTVDNATTNANTGNIKMTRTSRSMVNNDYIYWGTPVKDNGSLLSQIPTNFDSTYQWDLTGAIEGAWNALSAIVPGRGFITRVKTAVAATQSFNFTGVANNGTVNVTANAYDANFNLDTSGNTILLANPYPSALDATKFFDANTSILDGTLYFWTSSTANSGAAYSSNDYASWNKLGGTSTAPPTTNPILSLKPTGKIAAGQGFFADIHADGIISFTNAMRERTTSGNSQFFKTTKANKTIVEKHRIWLNLTNKKNAFRQMLVGYISDATNGFDRSLDGEAFTDNEINIYSVLDDKTLVIQGRALPFEDADMVPLGIVITNAGEYTIAIDEVDGIFKNGQDIYLEDKLLNVITNLKNPYTFNTAVGTFKDRFVLRYTDKTLGTTDFEKLENQVLVSNKNKQIKVNSKVESIDKVSVYDLLGRQLFKKDKVNSTELTIANLVSNQQTLVVKVTLQNGNIVTKKIML